MAPKVWIISKYASNKEYGFESRLWALGRRFAKSGREVLIISSDSNHFGVYPRFKRVFNYEQFDGVQVCWIKTLKYAKTISLKRILSWLDFELKLLLMPKKEIKKPDVIIVSSLSLLTILNGIFLARKYKAKLIFEIRDIWPLTLVAEGGYSPYNPFVLLLGYIEKLGYLHANLIVGTMPNLSEHVRNIIGENNKCRCIPFGFDPLFFEKSQEELTFELFRDLKQDGKFIIGYAGSIGLTNALESFFDAIRLLRDNNRFHFIILGDGNLRQKYEEEMGALNNVSFLGKVKRTQVQSVLKECDLLYFSVMDSDVWRYGLSLNKLIDYMMAAKPIVASYSGYPSMVNEAECGEFVPVGDTDRLIRVFEKYQQLDSKAIQSIGDRGKMWLLKNRNWDALCLDFLRLIDQMD